MSVTPEHDAEINDQDLAELQDPMAGVYAAGAGRLFLSAAGEHISGVIDHLISRQARLGMPGGPALTSYMAAEKIWADGLRNRVFHHAQECAPMTTVTAVLARSETLLRAELAASVLAAVEPLLAGDRFAAQSAALQEAGLRTTRTVMPGLRLIMMSAMMSASAEGDG
jgi:hypothetical protein